MAEPVNAGKGQVTEKLKRMCDSWPDAKMGESKDQQAQLNEHTADTECDDGGTAREDRSVKKSYPYV